MKVLVACEESQTVGKAFRALEHEAYSCDMQKQILMVFEEMAELQKELCKYLRNGESDEAVCRVAEELADVEIMLDQMKLLFGTGRVQREREKKVQRLRARLDAQAGSAQRRSIPWEAD